MIYFADLHVHSRYSRATSKECVLPEIARWAAIKGLRVLATGDFTHPAWSAEIKETLEEADNGLFRVKEEHAPKASPSPGGFGPRDVRFMLNVEISSIYKKNGATRRVHNLIFMPDLDSMDRFNETLGRLGNITSDGRPILGLDSKDLLEIALETTPESFLVPAHVWTPWFSVLGSKSGFDSIEECFEDLSSHIFALETGLSSDPEMNHAVGMLDRFSLISNSDTHSPANLGREANIFAGEPGYTAIREALKRGFTVDPPEDETDDDDVLLMNYSERPEPAFLGTVEFFPEEGKYHLDGHRKCRVRLDPSETEQLGGRCPVCGKPVTVGVMNRVMELADREFGAAPIGAAPFTRLLPLREIVSQAMGVGPQSKKVRAAYDDLIGKLGPEMNILRLLPVEEIDATAPDVIGEGIRRARRGEVHIEPGYDGEYGTVRLFTQEERDRLGGQTFLLPNVAAASGQPAPRRSRRTVKKRRPQAPQKQVPAPEDEPAPPLNDEQLFAASYSDGPMIVKAGPGSGKTRTLTHRAARLLEDSACARSGVTAVTFTRKAAAELKERLRRLVPEDRAARCRTGTFHQLGAHILAVLDPDSGPLDEERILDHDEAVRFFLQAASDRGLKVSASGASSVLERISLLKQNLTEPGSDVEDDEVAGAYALYQESMENAGLLDLDDLIGKPVRLLRGNPGKAREFREATAGSLLVDEFQDVNAAQYELIKLLTDSEGSGLFLIGDPDQAIYGFRGADRRFFFKAEEDFPTLRRVLLTRNYRSTRPILQAAHSVLNGDGPSGTIVAEAGDGARVTAAQLPGASTEGGFIVRTIESLIGGSSFLSVDSGLGSDGDWGLGLRDFAVLYRLNAVGDEIESAFKASGIPYQRAKRAKPEEESEALQRDVQAVALMTAHAAKGLEFPVVFVAGCNEGILPYTPERQSAALSYDLDEERRLLYVAMTRAERALYVTYARRRVLFGKTLTDGPSRFFRGLNADVCDFIDPLPKREEHPQPKQTALF